MNNTCLWIMSIYQSSKVKYKQDNCPSSLFDRIGQEEGRQCAIFDKHLLPAAASSIICSRVKSFKGPLKKIEEKEGGGGKAID